MSRFFLVFFLFSLPVTLLRAQTRVKGKVSDGETGEGLPYVNVFFPGTDEGTTTDFSGYFDLSTHRRVDSISVSYVGYTSVSKKIQYQRTQELTILLRPSSQNLSEVVVKPGVNKALRIIDRAQENKKKYNIEKLESYEYESFSKIQIAVDNISEKFKKRKLFSAMEPLFDTVSSLSGENKTPVLPVFISESLSDYYFRKNPRRTKEVIKATKVKGVGVSEDSYVNQLLGATFQQYNFNVNSLYILDKDFVSPISTFSHAYYLYTLLDSIYIDGMKTYKIQVNPKNKADLVFSGTIWITDSTFALKRLILEITKEANINFVEKLKIQQENKYLGDDNWLPEKTRVLIDIAEISENSLGFIGSYYSSNKNFAVNTNRDLKFFEERLVVLENSSKKEEKYWDTARHEKLTHDDVKVYLLVDSLRNQPIIRTYVDWVELAINGYKPLGKIEVGPYVYLYGWNFLEGHRVRAGFQTNEKLYKNLKFKGYGAYGFGDKKWKYGGSVEWVISRKKWTKAGGKFRSDVEQIGLTDKNYPTSALFDAFSTIGSRRLNRAEEGYIWGEHELIKGLTGKVFLSHKNYIFDSSQNFNFRYYTQPEMGVLSPTSGNFSNTSISLEARYSHKQLFMYQGYDRYSMGNYKSPVFTVSYTRGFKGVMGGSFDYNRFDFKLWQFNSIANLGSFEYTVQMGKIFGTLPFPLLEVMRGNQTFLSNKNAYNMMRFFEFAADRYISVIYEHQDNGVLANRVPLVQKAKLRFFGNVKAVYGDMTRANISLMPQSEGVTQIGQFRTGVPYVELGYGIENIFRLVRVDFIHRVNYLGNPNAKPFGIKLNLVFRF